MSSKGNKKAAFDKLFRDQYSTMVHTAYNILGNQSESEDVVQDLFVDLWKKEQSFDNITSVKAYLKKSTQYKCFDHLRKVKRLDNNKSKINPGKEIIHTISPEDDYISNEKVEHINAVINQLPDKGKAIFKMSRFDGMTYKEISDTLQISLKTVEYHMSQNLKFLRQAIFCWLLWMI